MCTAMLYEPKLTTVAEETSKSSSSATSINNTNQSSKGFASKLLNWFRKK
jgi:hypothetical protein